MSRRVGSLILVLTLIGAFDSVTLISAEEENHWDALFQAGRQALEAENFDDAKLHLTAALEVSVAIDDEMRALATRNLLGILYFETSDYARALPLLKDVVAAHEERFTIGLGNLAAVHVALGNDEQARHLLELYVDATERSLGEGHPRTARGLGELSSVLGRLGEYEAALAAGSRAAQIHEDSFGRHDAAVVKDLGNLALIHYMHGRWDTANSTIREAIERANAGTSAAQALVPGILVQLAKTYHADGLYIEAEALYLEAIAYEEHLAPAGSSDLASHLRDLAILYSEMGFSGGEADRYGDAETLFRRALAIDEKVLGTDSPIVATDLYYLAGLYQTLGRYAEAEPLYTRSLAIDEKVHGPDYPGIVATLKNFAILLRKTGRTKEAEAAERRAQDIRQHERAP